MLSRQSLEILIDLVEIKLSTIMIMDKEDIREIRRLKNCRNELIRFVGATYAKKIPTDGTAATF
jgi:hypothetical protein